MLSSVTMRPGSNFRQNPLAAMRTAEQKAGGPAKREAAAFLLLYVQSFYESHFFEND